MLQFTETQNLWQPWWVPTPDRRPDLREPWALKAYSSAGRGHKDSAPYLTVSPLSHNAVKCWYSEIEWHCCGLPKWNINCSVVSINCSKPVGVITLNLSSCWLQSTPKSLPLSLLTERVWKLKPFDTIQYKWSGYWPIHTLRRTSQPLWATNRVTTQKLLWKAMNASIACKALRPSVTPVQTWRVWQQLLVAD